MFFFLTAQKLAIFMGWLYALFMLISYFDRNFVQNLIKARDIEKSCPVFPAKKQLTHSEIWSPIYRSFLRAKKSSLKLSKKVWRYYIVLVNYNEKILRKIGSGTSQLSITVTFFEKKSTKGAKSPRKQKIVPDFMLL